MRKIFFLLFYIVAIFSCNDTENQKGKGESWAHHDLKTKQYLIEGKKLYTLHCSNCHMDDGKGLARLIPPLAQSNYMKADVERTICIIKNGMSGEITVNGEVYNHPMPEFKNLTHIEIAEISTYIYNAWGHDKGIITIPQVREALIKCRDFKADGGHQL